MRFINKIKQWLMRRYCPGYKENMPVDAPGRFCSEAVISYGYWGNKYRVVAEKEVNGLRQAYMTARWLALKAQWMRPELFFSCGIHYGVRPLDNENRTT